MALVNRCLSLSSTSGLPLLRAPLPSLNVLSSRNLGRRPPKPGKPPILPPSKKVLYKVVHPEWMKPEDVKELLWRRHTYNNAVVSLRHVFKAEIEAKEAAGLGIEALKAREKEELDALLVENEKHNQQKAQQREAEEKDAYEKLKTEFLEDIEKRLAKEEQNAKERTTEVLQLIEESQNFVTKDNLDVKLKEALDNPIVFDYCIDLNGQKFPDPLPLKYVEGTPTRQKGRAFDRSLVQPRKNAPKEAASSA
uniref:Small ribosomal subunit protein mS26 n=1 Tax=Panagrellus redivivus TaxID=6233 RepID=A0A7E4VJY4_PANRE